MTKKRKVAEDWLKILDSFSSDCEYYNHAHGERHGPDVVITADVVFYADGTFDQQNEDQFKRMVARRQSQLLAMKKVNEIVRAALADSANDHPTEAAITELAKATAEEMAHNPDGPYNMEFEQIESLRAGFPKCGRCNGWQRII